MLSEETLTERYGTFGAADFLQQLQQTVSLRKQFVIPKSTGSDE
jgi:hypothetical protein